jgi:hypothetical protein
MAVLFAIAMGCLLLGPEEAHGQSSQNGSAGPPGQARVAFIVGLPQGQFSRNVGRGLGAEIDYGGWLGQTPAMFGLSGSFYVYGRSTDRVPFSRTVGPRVPIDVTTTNGIGNGHLFLRLQERTGPFRPYVEALGGFKYLYSRTSVETADRGLARSNEIAGTVNFDSFAWSGGLGAGADIRVLKQPPSENLINSFSVHVGGQYLFGSETEYLEEGPLRDQNDNDRLERDELRVRRSRTSLLHLKIGVTMRLGKN